MPKSLLYVWFLVSQSLLLVSAHPIVTDTCCVSLSSCPSCSQQDVIPRLDVPSRSESGLTGSDFVMHYASASLELREETVVSEVLSGNIPDFLRVLVGVSVKSIIDSTEYTLTYFVTPDYLSIGPDTDHFLVPLGPISAQRIADSLGTVLPTRVMVDQIWDAAEVKLEPQPIPPSDSMTSVSVMGIHDRIARNQRSQYVTEFPLGSLVAGHKKDVILSKKIYDHPNAPRVVIYGWHQANGSPIQPVYNGHALWYADYSHGIRLVSRKAVLNGNTADLLDLLCDERLHKLISDEGPICTGYSGKSHAIEE
jgi:hypothetical protein